MQRRPERWTGPPRRLVSPRRVPSPRRSTNAALSPSQVDGRPCEPVDASVVVDVQATDKRSPAKPQPLLNAQDAQLGGYPADCGTEHFKYLSLAKAKRERALTHAMSFSTTEQDAGGFPKPGKYPLLATDFGSHSFQTLPTDSRVLDQFGVGVALYFKFVKVMAWLFLLLAALSLPPMVVFVVGGGHEGGFQSPWEEVRTLAKQDPSAVLGVTSLGHLQEASSECSQASTGETLNLACSTGEIGFIKAIYSAKATQGTCSCPEKYSVADGSDMCRGSPIVACSHGPDFMTNQCTATCPSDGFGCFLGAHPISGDSCCAFHLDGAIQEADFDELRIQSRKKCGSRTAQKIVEGLCLGRASCSVVVDEMLVQSWEPKNNASCPMGSTTVRTKNAEGEGLALNLALVADRRCEARLGDEKHSNFTGCPNEERALIVFARCFATRVKISTSWSLTVLGFDSVSRKAFLSFAVGCDIVCSIVFILVLRWLRKQEKAAIAHSSRNNQIKASDYTVQLHRLPSHQDVDELREELESHIENVLSSAPPVSIHLDRIRIADIQFGQRATSSRLDVLRRRGKIVRKLEAVQQRIAMLRHLRGRVALATEAYSLSKREQKHERERIKLEEKMVKMDSLLERLKLQQQQEDEEDLNLKRMNKPRIFRSPAVTAFITFEEEEGVLRCLQEYPDLGLLHQFMQPVHKRFRGKRLRFRPAPDPSDVVWENLHYSFSSRVLRQLMTALVTFVVLLVSFAVTFLAELQKAKLERQLGPAASCPESVTKEDVSLDELHKAIGLSPYKSLVQCFCRQVLAEESFMAMTRETFTDLSTSDGERFYCYEWATTYATTQALDSVVVLTVVIVNLMLSGVLKGLVRVERHHTRSKQVISHVTKVFLAQFCNTALLMVALNANVDYFINDNSTTIWESSNGSYFSAKDMIASFRVTAGKIFTGKYSDFSPGWYSDVGVALLLTALANAVSPHVWALFAYFLAKLRRARDRGLRTWRDESRTSCATQRDLEALHRGPPFNLAARYAEVLTAVFVSYLFSAGIPLLHFVGLLSMLTTYWADKLTFLRVARLPPALDGRVAAAAGSLLPYAVFLHCIVALWMFSNAKIFQSDEDVADQLASFKATQVHGIVHYEGEVGEGVPAFDAITSGEVWGRVTRPQVAVLFAFIVSFVVVIVARSVLFSVITAAGRAFFPCLARVFGYAPTKRRARNLPNYFEAIPTQVLAEKLGRPNVLLPRLALREKYEREFEKRRQQGTVEQITSPSRKSPRKQRAMSAAEHFSAMNWIVGCPSYAISDNKEYVAALAIDSELSEQLKLNQLL